MTQSPTHPDYVENAANLIGAVHDAKTTIDAILPLLQAFEAGELSPKDFTNDFVAKTTELHKFTSIFGPSVRVMRKHLFALPKASGVEG